ncbi:hypothetical protein BGZ65_009293 [Modicella reniformis]|uniref:Uncharacterized protein n=1 Tax=Modicella reniformis TaxID=1440133 RepID=A0A9P6MEE7_9FUNG|nr:hypothetical protein BGZ65_009293 [Modicella reniformis]
MHISVLSITTARFLSFSTDVQGTAKSIFKEDDELFQAMQQSINKVAATNPSNISIFTEVKANEFSVEIATCVRRELKPMLCLYASINGFVLMPQEDVTEIHEVHGIRLPGINSTSYAAMSINHVPQFSDGEWVYHSIETLRNNTFTASEYMARLGLNFYIDKVSGMTYMLYDPLKEGVRVPNWLAYSTIVVITICFCFWVSIMILLRGSHADSLYKNISRQLASKAKTTGTSIMRSTTNPLTIEGISLMCGQDELTFEVDGLGLNLGIMDDDELF